MGIDKREASEKMAVRTRKARKDELPRKIGCSVPLSGGCVKGMPLPTSLKDGVKMVCSNAQCPFKEQLVHRACFDDLEDYLVKIMSNLGSARGWTDAQRRANLWDKKGFTLVQRLCRCPCGLGIVRVDESAHFQVVKEANTSASTKHKKTKAKNLPKLNFGCGSTCETPASLLVDIVVTKPGTKSRPHESRAQSPFSIDADHFGIVENGYVPYAKPAGKHSGTLCESEFTRLASNAPVPVKFDKVHSEKSNAAKSRLVTGELSYAKATAVPKVADETNEIPREAVEANSHEQSQMQFEVLSVPHSYDSALPSEDLNATLHSRSVSICDGDSIGVDFWEENESNETTLGDVTGNFHAITSEKLMPNATPMTYGGLPICTTGNLYEGEMRANAAAAESASLCYNLFHGSSFFLGERLLANTFLPGLI